MAEIKLKEIPDLDKAMKSYEAAVDDFYVNVFTPLVSNIPALCKTIPEIMEKLAVLEKGQENINQKLKKFGEMLQKD